MFGKCPERTGFHLSAMHDVQQQSEPTKGILSPGYCISLKSHPSKLGFIEHAVVDCERIVDETICDLARVLGLREPLLVGLGHGSRYARGGTIGLDPCSPKPHHFEDPLEGCTADSLRACRDVLPGLQRVPIPGLMVLMEEEAHGGACAND